MLSTPLFPRRSAPPESATDITIDVGGQPTPNGKAFDAFTLILDHSTGEYVRRGRVFRCRNMARRWLSRQSVAVKP